VEPGTHLDPQRRHGVHDRARAADAARRAVERREEAVAGGIELAAAVAGEAAADCSVVLCDELGPVPVAELCLAGRRVDDVREEDGREHAVELRLLVEQLVCEGLDRVDVRVGALLHHGRLGAGHRLPPRAGDQRRKRAGLVLHRTDAAAQDERRHADRAEHVADVGFVEHAGQPNRVSARGGEVHPLEPPLDRFLARHAGERPRNVALGVRACPPAVLHLREHPFELPALHPPRVVGRPGDPGSGVHQNQPEHPLRVRGGKEAREWAAVRAGDEQSAVGTHGIEHRPRIVHPLLDRREAAVVQAVGHAHAAPVEADQAAERFQPLDRGLPGRRMAEREAEDVRAEVEHVDPTRAGTRDPIGDVVLAALRVLDLACGHEQPLRITSSLVLVAGNWKMYKGAAETAAFLAAFEAPAGVEVVVCPSYTSLSAAVGHGVPVYAQNVHWASEGAFTGEVSAPMLRELGVAGAIVGHSERRQLFGETDETVRLRCEAALAAGLAVIACVGETEAEREAGETTAVLRRQVGAIPEHAALVIAYEPVWAIGTGKTATPELAQEAHETIKELHDTRVLYGGSVKPENAAALMARSAVDGALVGGASLEPESFAAICRAAAQ
jgi:triosephosphate isomerase (TIM)